MFLKKRTKVAQARSESHLSLKFKPYVVMQKFGQMYVYAASKTEPSAPLMSPDSNSILPG